MFALKSIAAIKVSDRGQKLLLVINQFMINNGISDQQIS